MNEFLIREGTAKEHNAIAELAAQLFPESNPRFHKEDLVLVAETTSEPKELVGFIHLSILESKAILRAIGVKPEYQNQGIGRRLMEFGIQKLPATIPVYLKVEPGNTKAISLYIENGFMQSKQGGELFLVRLPAN